MGLGLFLARAVIEGVGGTLQIDSTAGQGTEVAIQLPTEISAPEPSRVARSSEPAGSAVVSKSI